MDILEQAQMLVASAPALDGIERARQITSLRFQVEKRLAEIGRMVVEMNTLGCKAAIKYEQKDETSGEIGLVYGFDDAPEV